MSTTDQHRLNGAAPTPRPPQALKLASDAAIICPDCGGAMRESVERVQASGRDAGAPESLRLHTCLACNRADIVRPLGEPEARRQRLDLHDRGTDAFFNDAMPPS